MYYTLFRWIIVIKAWWAKNTSYGRWLVLVLACIEWLVRPQENFYSMNWAAARTKKAGNRLHWMCTVCSALAAGPHTIPAPNHKQHHKMNAENCARQIIVCFSPHFSMRTMAWFIPRAVLILLWLNFFHLEAHTTLHRMVWRWNIQKMPKKEVKWKKWAREMWREWGKHKRLR